MGAFNQAQAHAQFVANVVDYEMPLQQAIAMLVDEATPPDLRKTATATAA